MKLDRVIAVRNNKTIYRDGDRCVKVFNEDYSKADVLNEALNQARIEETGLNIPKVLEVTTIDGKWAIVSEYIKGKTLAQLMEENPEKKNEYLELFVDLQMTVQSKTCPLLNKLKDKMNRKISSAQLDATTIRSVTVILTRPTLLLQKTAPHISSTGHTPPRVTLPPMWQELICFSG